MKIKKWLAGLALSSGLLTLTATPIDAAAQAWPTRQPIKLVAVFPPGGSVDQVARILAQPLSQQLGQSVIVENKGGASGSIGTAAVAAAPPDGYTFAVVFDTHGVNPSLIPGLPFDTRKDLAPVVLVGTSAMVLATNAGSEFKSFADVVAAAKAKKNVSYGSIGSGSLGHLAMALLGKSGGLDWQHVPYKGGGPLMTDAIAGHVPLSIASVFVTKPHLDNKRMRAAGGYHQQTRGRTAGRADGGGERLPRLRRAGLVGGAGPGEDAARDRAPHERGTEQGAEVAGRGGAAVGAGHQRDRRLARCCTHFHRQADRHLGAGRQGKQHQSRLIGGAVRG